MKLPVALCASLLLLTSGVGCCCLSSCGSNSCDPCGDRCVGGCLIHKIFHSGCLSCLKSKLHGCGCGGRCGSCSTAMASCCDSGMPAYYGGGEVIYGGDMHGGSCAGGHCGAPGITGDAGCGCGQPHGPVYPQSQSMNYAPQMMTPQLLAPQPIAPTPLPNSGTSAPPPVGVPEVPGAETPTGGETTGIPAAGKVQHVSAEEFQRLPGTIISGPTMTSAAPAQFVPAAAPVQQSSWVPTTNK